MNVALVFFLLLVSQLVFGFHYPKVVFTFLKKIPSTVYFGESLRLPIEMIFVNLRQQMIWRIPKGAKLEISAGDCRPLSAAYGEYWLGACYMNLIIPGAALGQSINGAVEIQVVGKKDNHNWNYPFGTNGFNIKTIPHCPTFVKPSIQYATANQNFNLNLKNWVKYYDENSKAQSSISLKITPTEQHGLHFDPKSLSLTGKPNSLGTYRFNIQMQNAACDTRTTSFQVEVKANLQDKPIFKKQASLMAGFPKQKYTMNLMNLIESHQGFTNNQAHFRLVPEKTNAHWLHVSALDNTKLEGVVPEHGMGQTYQATLVASTNTGGDSQPITLAIPIAYDPVRKPEIRPFTISKEAGDLLEINLAKYIGNVGDEPLKLFIDQVEPLAPWLSQSDTSLKGLIPLDTVGQLFHITLRVSTSVGGSSEPYTIPLQVQINRSKKPKFKEDLVLPFAISGKSYFYDFKEHNSVTPKDIPYEVELAADYPNPGWIELKNNQLIVEEVPELYESKVVLYLLVKNIPGGSSNTQEVILTLSGSKDISSIRDEQ